ncbi:MAG TPA: hypothetical protein DGF30_02800 [Desulfomicrobium sp.]|nr:hypothetical protein [Desulfomicrobium sp.]
MVTLAGLRRRLENLSTMGDQILIFRGQPDGSVLVSTVRPGRPAEGGQHFESGEAACDALGLDAGGPSVTIQRSWL